MLYLINAVLLLGAVVFAVYTAVVCVYLSVCERKINACFKELGNDRNALLRHLSELWEANDPMPDKLADDLSDAAKLLIFLEDYRPNQTKVFEFYVLKERFEGSLESYRSGVLEYNATLEGFPVCMIASVIGKKVKMI